ncbi:MAG: hypothetical protein U0S48_16460 [Solirubrobacteraceae bacterium]
MWRSTSTSTRSMAPMPMSSLPGARLRLTRTGCSRRRPRQADRRLAVAAEAQDDVLVDLADEHHLGDLDRVGVGDLQAADELDRHVALHAGGDLGAAAVDDHRVHADVSSSTTSWAGARAASGPPSPRRRT